MGINSVTKDKNFLMFNIGDNKAYKFDINTGIWYGLRGKPLAGSAFAGLVSYLDYYGDMRDSYNVLYLLRCIRLRSNSYGINHTIRMNEYAQFADYFKIADRLESIGYKKKWAMEYTLDNLKKVSIYFKPFAKWLKDNEGKNFLDFLKEREYEEWIAKHRLIPNNHGLTETLIKRLWEERYHFEDDEIDYAVYYATHGLTDWYDIEEVNLTSRFGEYQRISKWNEMFSKIASYLKLCKDMGIKPEKENMLQSYVNLRRTYITNRKQFDAQALKRWYDKFPMLQFEDDNYTVVIPKTREDFINEANSQNNCVYSYYFEPVTKGDTLVVFIRKKDNPNKSYITCEVNPNSGSIKQYLGVNNSRIYDASALDFKRAYAQHLLSKW